MSTPPPLFRKARSLEGHKGVIYAIRFNATGTYCLSAGQDNTVRLWNPFRASDPTVQVYRGAHGRGVVDVTSSRDNRSFATCGNDKVALVWDVESGVVRRKFWQHDLTLNAVTFNEEGSVLVTASNDRFARVFDCRSRASSPIQKLGGFKDSVTCLSIHGHRIVAGSIDGTVRVYDIRAGQVHLDTFGGGATHVSLSKDGKVALVGTMKSRVYLYEMSNGKDLQQYVGHRSSAYKVACVLSNTEAYVLSGSEDGQIRIWDLVRGSEMSKLNASSYGKTVCGLDFHPTKACFVSCGHDGLGSLWVAET